MGSEMCIRDRYWVGWYPAAESNSADPGFGLRASTDARQLGPGVLIQGTSRSTDRLRTIPNRQVGR